MKMKTNGDIWRIWNFVRLPGVLVMATVLPLNLIVDT